jgi:hypothetical protein
VQSGDSGREGADAAHFKPHLNCAVMCVAVHVCAYECAMATVTYTRWHAAAQAAAKTRRVLQASPTHCTGTPFPHTNTMLHNGTKEIPVRLYLRQQSSMGVDHTDLRGGDIHQLVRRGARHVKHGLARVLSHGNLANLGLHAPGCGRARACACSCVCACVCA